MTLSDLWLLIAAGFVFLMQAGFLCFEVGLARRKHQPAVALKNLIDWAIVTTLFLLIGFGVMFGDSAGGLFGVSRFGGDVGELPGGFDVQGLTFLLFQLTFAGTAITIVSGALVERITVAAYAVLTAAMAVAIYPVIGHWVWGGTIGGADGWLRDLGFHDFAGAGVVHLTGAAVALVGIAAVGPRLGRFGADGSVRDFAPSNTPMAALGTVVLWLGWWGFNGGSAFGATADVPLIILRTNIAGAGGLLAALVVALVLGDTRRLGVTMITGALAGLVAITAVADRGSLLAAFALGVIAGGAAPHLGRLLLSLKIDDALGVVPIHGAGAVIGLVLGPVLTGTGDLGLVEAVVVQLLGVGAIIGWSAIVGGALMVVLRRTIGLRVAPSQERLDADDEPTPTPVVDAPRDRLTEADLADLL